MKVRKERDGGDEILIARASQSFSCFHPPITIRLGGPTLGLTARSFVIEHQLSI